MWYDPAPVFDLSGPEDDESLSAWWAKQDHDKTVFTCGIFDLLGAHHVRFLARAAELGRALVVGINSDASTRRLKGPARPIYGQEHRAYLLSQLGTVDAVIVFYEDTPLKLLRRLRPHCFVKGDVFGQETEGAGYARVAKRIPLYPGSTSQTIVDILERYRDGRGGT